MPEYLNAGYISLIRMYTYHDSFRLHAQFMPATTELLRLAPYHINMCQEATLNDNNQVFYKEPLRTIVNRHMIQPSQPSSASDHDSAPGDSEGPDFKDLHAASRPLNQPPVGSKRPHSPGQSHSATGQGGCKKLRTSSLEHEPHPPTTLEESSQH